MAELSSGTWLKGIAIGDCYFCLRLKSSQRPDAAKIPLPALGFSSNCGVGVCTKTRVCTSTPFHSFTTFLWGNFSPGIGERWAHWLNGFWSACLRRHMLLCCSSVEILRLFLITQAGDYASKHSPGEAFGYRRGACTCFGIDICCYFFFSFVGEGRI